MRARIATLVVILLCYATAMWGPATDPTPALLVLSSMSLFLELLAVPQRGFGFFSCAFACQLAMTLTASIGSRWALAVVSLGLLLRTALRGNPQPAVRWREALADLVPSVAGLASASSMLGSYSVVWAAVGGLFVYLPLCLWIPEWLAEESPGVEVHLWRHLREMTGYHCFAVGFLGPITGYLTSLGPIHAAWLLPVFVTLQRASRTDLLRLEEIEKGILQEKARRSQLALQDASQRLQKASITLQVQVQSRFLLEELTRRLAQCPNQQAVWDVLVDCLTETVPYRSLVLFRPMEGELLPVQWRSANHAALESAALHRKTEPIVERAWGSLQSVLQEDVQSPERLFPNEPIALAIPLQGQGVIYVGRSADQSCFQETESDILKTVASQGALAFQSVRRFQDAQEALELYQKAHGQLSQWVQRLSLLLEGTRALNATLEADALLERFQHIVEGLLPEHRGALIFQDQQHLIWPPGSAPWTGLQSLHQVVIGSGRPLLIEDFSTTRWSPPQPDLRSLLAAPLIDEDGPWGSVLLASPVAGLFIRQHQDLLCLLCSQVVAALRRANLQGQIRESQAKLAQSSKMAAVGQLAAGVAHELNTPLSAVVLQLDSALLRLDSRPDLVRSKIDIALQALEKVRNIVAKLLNYSREGQAGQKQLDLNEVVRDTLLLIAGQIEIDGVKIDSALRQPLPPVAANQTELQQVLTNLLLNARDAALQSQRRQIEVETGTTGDHVYLQVTDFGPGIPAEIREHIFEPFFTTKPVGQGTGLGLSICQEIVQRHRGQLHLLEESDRTVFRLLLQRAHD